jgi:hypothetical protein
MNQEPTKEPKYKDIREILNKKVVKFAIQYDKEIEKKYFKDEQKAKYLVGKFLSLKNVTTGYVEALQKFLGNTKKLKIKHSFFEDVETIVKAHNKEVEKCAELTQKERNDYEVNSDDLKKIIAADLEYNPGSKHNQSDSPKIVKSASNKKQLIESLKLFFDENSCPEFLKNSTFYLFERVGLVDPFKNKSNLPEVKYWGVTVGRIIFHNIEFNLLRVTFNRKYYTDKEIEYEGFATKDNDNIYLDLINKADRSRLQIVLRLNKKDPQNQDIFMGHFTFFSPEFGNRIITKVVLLIKEGISLDEKNTCLQNLKLGQMSYDEDKFVELPQEIKSFLSGREQMRLYVPVRDDLISNLNTLDIFFKKDKTENVNSILEDEFTGEYFTYYKRSNNTLVQDNFSIKYSPYSNALEVHYQHFKKRKFGKPTVKNWYGKPYLNANRYCIIIELATRYPKEKQDIRDEDPILLTFRLDKDEDWKASDIFSGIISGLEDDDNDTQKPGGIALLCLVVRKNVEHDGIEDNRIEKFFSDNSNNSLVKINDNHRKFRLDDI